ncbi:CNNM domain-containing protein [Candidatus Ichthyocystis hellenicum]|uniref:CNNM domain-containing protein n=1 Tax=Candidatus Ichthyocystis hellenicum TaxID=1561003 RepID=UPI000B89F0D2|nr:CNNM domain-containing protein [Candidatus Ichthyocystis hellenicum]
MFSNCYGIQVFFLVVLILISGFFSMAETSMMAVNRYMLEALSERGNRAAVRTLKLLSQVDYLLGAILLGNNLANAAVATLMAKLSLAAFGQGEYVLGATTICSAFLILVFAEVIPKIIGNRFANYIAVRISIFIRIFFILFFPVIHLTRMISKSFLSVFDLPVFKRYFRDSYSSKNMEVGALKVFLMEYSNLIVSEHRDMLLNLASLRDVTVEDLMVPRRNIEDIDISHPISSIMEKIATARHSRMPVYSNDYQEIIGVLSIKRVFGSWPRMDITLEEIRSLTVKAIFVPGSNSALEQLRVFIESHERFAIVVDEYGEVLGIITADDIVDEIIGKLSANPMPLGQPVTWGEDNSVILDGAVRLREINRRLSVSFPLDGAKTLNGWILSQLMELPEGDVSIRVGNVVVETLQVSDKYVRLARLRRIYE